MEAIGRASKKRSGIKLHEFTHALKDMYNFNTLVIEGTMGCFERGWF
jgi:hypothetical protein